MIIKTSYPFMKPPPSARLIRGHRLAQGLIGYLPFNENGGLQVFDLSENGLVGTFQSTTSWASGKFGSAVNFNGTTDYINIPQSNLTGHAQASFVLWIWAASGAQADSYAVIMSFENISDGYKVEQNSSNNQLNYMVKNASDGLVQVLGATNFFDGNWHQIGLSYDGANINIIEDGVLVNSAAQTGLVKTTAADLNIGAYKLNQNLFAGLVDHAIIWNRALSLSEFAELYTKPSCMLERRARTALMSGYEVVIPPEGIVVLRRRRESA